MEIIDRFDVPAAPDAVWAIFQDVPNLVACMPGVELTDQPSEDVFAGKMTVRLGPMKPAFEGEARVERDPATLSGVIVAKGKDKKGGSRADARVSFSIHEVSTGSRVELVSSVNMMGQLGQFGRTNLLTDISAHLTAQFAECLAEKMAAPTQVVADSVQAEELRPVVALVAIVRLRVQRLMRHLGEWLLKHSGDD